MAETSDPTADDLRCSCPMGLNVPRDPECAVHRRVGDDVEAWELREAQRVAKACGLSLRPPPQPGTVTLTREEMAEHNAAVVRAALDPQPGTVTLPAGVVRALLPENTETDKAAVLHARRVLADADR